jgi:glycosyltransferase involved in cell wall biosynthesis
MPTPPVLIVVPCFDEERRLVGAEFLRLVRADPRVGVLFVDDGSGDGTRSVLEEVRAAAPHAISVLALERNGGKAEAVRAGLREALRSGAQVVGYADADLSTPVDELRRMVDSMAAAPVQVLLGSRVRLLGTRIERRAARHYLGRVFATAASLALGLPVYDTQCGAKLFARSDALAASLEQPFSTRWIFDVELLARLLAGERGAPPVPAQEMREFPLHAWRDVGGSKLRGRAMLRAGFQLLRLLARRLLARPRAVPGSGPSAGATGEMPSP